MVRQSILKTFIAKLFNHQIPMTYNIDVEALARLASTLSSALNEVSLPSLFPSHF